MRFVACLFLASCAFHVDAVPLGDQGAPDARAPDLASAAPDLASAASDFAAPADLSPPPDLTIVLPPSLSGAKVLGPASVDLTAEGTTDWIHRGFASANDVNRKASGGSRITATASTTVTQYTMYTTTFSWGDGTPTPSASKTPNGVYTLGATQGFTITAPADNLRVRTLRVYLNVGGTAALTAHLSDGSAPDYTDSQSNTNNGESWLYTFQYSTAAASGALSITWTLTSGTGVSFLAATLE